MLNFHYQVCANGKMDPLEAAPISLAILFVRSACESAVAAFAGSIRGTQVVYANGRNGTEWDCAENGHLPMLKVLRPGENKAIAMLCYGYSKLTGTTRLTVYHRKSLDDKFEEFEVSAYPYSMSAEEWREIANAFEAAFDDKGIYDPIWAESEEEVDAI